MRTLRSLAPLSGALTALVGAVNVASTLTPNLAWRGHLLLAFEPVEVVPVLHALALPAGVGLLAVAPYLARGRRRAWLLAVVLLAGAGLLNVLKGLDVEEALVSWVLAGALVAGRRAFPVEHPGRSLGAAALSIALLAATVAVVAVAAVALPDHALGPWATVREALDLLLLLPGFATFPDDFGWVPYALGALGTGTLVAALYLVFRPLAAPRDLPSPRARAAALRLVREHGADTLSFFKLRADKHYLFSRDGRAFLGYRVENGVLLVSGDPVGPAEALPGLLEELHAFAELRGLRIGVIGAGTAMLDRWRALGLRSLYLGDEAIVELAGFALDGRRMKKMRQAVGRVQRAGYTTELLPVAACDAELLGELERVSELWRDGQPERGFSMCMDTLRGPHLEDTEVIVARDGEGRVRGFLHFVPARGGEAMSLSFMRRERDTPNGLTEFMVVRAIEALRGRGVRELSLNFAAFARWMHDPAHLGERLLGRVAALGNRWFQVESLYRFNARFQPRWEPRHLLFDRPLALPRVGLAALWAEGQLPRPPRLRSDER